MRLLFTGATALSVSALGVVGAEFAVAGHGGASRDTCGKLKKIEVCLNAAGHGFTFDRYGELVDHTNQVYVRLVPMSCNSPSCPTCFKRWAFREGQRIEERLFEASKIYGLVEHICLIPPEWDCSLDYYALRHKMLNVARSRGIIGASVVFHHTRYTRARGRYIGFHFHLLGFISGGYGCRGCKLWCSGHPDCNGFENLTRRLNVSDGWIVKVMEKRAKAYGSDKPNVAGTARYELGHASYRVGVKRANVVTYFGVCSYRKLKVAHVMVPSVCPECKHELVEANYVGVDAEFQALLYLRFEGVSRCVWLDLPADGSPIFELSSGEPRVMRWRKGTPF
jgi:hypothetical protein